MKAKILLVAAMIFSATPSNSAEDIVGNWKTPSGALANIASCGVNYCVTLKSGKYAGRQIGKLGPASGGYKGELTDPQADKTYSGSATVSGAEMKLKGCMMAVLCKTQTWTRQ